MNAVSLFAGVGGIDLALESAGIPVVAAVEIDDAARGVLKHRFPDVSLFSDVCEVMPDDLLAAGFNPGDGVLAGGFPCQDLSVAGKRAGLDGKRSGLFWEIIRLAEALKPQWLLLENVPGLLSSNGGRDMGTVIGALVDIGYGVSWRVLDAQYFGLAQRRKRLFFVCCLGDDGNRAGEVLALSEVSSGDPRTRRTPGQDIAYALAARFGDVGVDATDVLNGHVIAQPVSGDRLDASLVPTVTSKWAKGSGGPAGDEMQNTVTYVKKHRASSTTDFETWDADPVAPTLSVFDQGDSRATVLAVHEEPAVIGFNWQNGGGYQNSNDGLAITAEGTGPLSRSQVPAIATRQVVRRITPLECERLQGFPDRWTEERWDWKKGRVVHQADAPRYRQMGNAVAVPVVAWIARRIVEMNARLTADAQVCEDAPGMDIPCTPITGDTP